MSSAQSIAYDEIERFNAFAANNVAKVCEDLFGVSSMTDIVDYAKGLDFKFTEDDMHNFIMDKSSEFFSEEQLGMLAGGGGFTFSYTCIAVNGAIASFVGAIAAAVLTVVAVLEGVVVA